jgi:hypothetical protein
MRLFLSALLALLVSGTALAAPLVINGGFETGDFTGWTVAGASTGVVCSNGVIPAHSGNCESLFSGAADSLGQNITTIPGHSYTLEFWFHYRGSVGTGNFSASWNGSPIFLQSDSGASSPPYSDEVFPGLSVSSSSTPLLFTINNSNSSYLLDDVSVVDNGAAAPEPGTIGMLLAGVAVLGMAIVLKSFGYGSK